MLLGDMGADVVKVESPAATTPGTWVPPVRDDVSTYFLGVNRNKRSVVLDLKDPRTSPLAGELAGRADVVLENFKPGGLDRFGLGYDDVAAANPGVVYASISGFGPGGGRSLPGYDLIVQAISGLMSLTGDPDGPPYRAGISVFDVMTGLHATIGVLAALHARAATGRGQHVEVNLLSSALSGLVNQTSAVVAGGVVPFRMGNAHPSLFPYDALPAADQELIITAGNDGQFRTLCQVLGVPELVDDPRFRGNQDRTANREELRALLVERPRTRTADEWFRELIAAGRAVRTDQHRRRRGRLRRAAGPRSRRPDRAGRRTVRPAPDHVLGHARPVRAAAARARRARRRDPGLADRPGRAGRTDRAEAGMSDRPTYPTSLGTSDADSITLLGQDLASDLMGKVGFGELAFWLVAGRRPTPGEVRVFEAVLVALADHGFTPTAIAARLTYLSAPDSLQGALAAGLLGGGSRFLGVTEDAGRFLADALAAHDGPLPTDDAGWDALALGVVREARAAGGYVPGLGHPVHKVTDPRTPVLLAIAEEEGLRGPHLRLYEAIGRVHPQVLGRTPAAQRRRRVRCGAGRPRAAGRDAARVRAAGPCRRAARAARGGAAPARSRWTCTWTSTGTRSRCRSRDPSSETASEERTMAELAAVIASTHHPFYYKASTAPPDEAPPFAAEWVRKVEAFRETLTRAEPDVLLHRRLRPLPPAVARQHAAVPRRARRGVRRELVQRGARVRAAADAHARRPEPVRSSPARGPRRRLRPRLQQRAADRPQRHVPDHHAAPAERPARSSPSTRTSSRRRCRSRSGSSSWAGCCASWSRRGRATSGSPSSAPVTCRSSSAARASSGRTAPTPSSTPGRWSGSRTATSRAASRR